MSDDSWGGMGDDSWKEKRVFIISGERGLVENVKDWEGFLNWLEWQQPPYGRSIDFNITVALRDF